MPSVTKDDPSSDDRRTPRAAESDRAIPLAGGALGEQHHICAFFNGVDEEHRVLHSFITDGFHSGDKTLHIVDPRQRDDHLQRLRHAGVDVDGAMASGQLDVRPWEEGHLRGDRFEQDVMLRLVEEILASNAAAGYTRTRILGHMEWALLDRPGVHDLVEYEARVNDVIGRYHSPVICAYDLSRFNASVVVDVLRTHPMVIIGGVLQENPFFVPPQQFLAELRARKATGRATTIAS